MDFPYATTLAGVGSLSPPDRWTEDGGPARFTVPGFASASHLSVTSNASYPPPFGITVNARCRSSRRGLTSVTS